MNYLESISKMALAGLAVWRLTRTVHAAFDHTGARIDGQPLGFVSFRPEDAVGSRVMDFLYWIGLWMSAQTALWVVCGFSGVLLNWLAVSGIARLFGRSKQSPDTDFGVCVPSSPAHAPAQESCNGAAELCL